MINANLLKNTNIQAFLKMIRFSEGTAGEDGYRTMFGGTMTHPLLFDSFDDHPRQKHTGGGFTSDAAGAYQFLSSTWDDLKKKLNLTDFSPENQDLACCQLFNEKNALNDVWNGNFAVAVAKLNTTWASLPGSPYSQPTHPLAFLEQHYLDNGGIYGAVKNEA